MVSLDVLRLIWVASMLVLGVVIAIWIYLAHYSAPASSEAEAPSEDDPAPPPATEAHEFPQGIRELNLPVPASLVLFVTGMGVLAVVYLLWMRLKVGSY